MSNHPKGDTALSRAITTGAPVATNDAQANELTQRWGVWFVRAGSDDAGEWIGNGRRPREHFTASESVARDRAEKLARAHPHNTYEVCPYPTPTPPPTPPASSGGEWTTRENLLIRGDNFCANASDTATARDLAARLNAADAMEKALKDIDNLPFHATHAEVIAIVMQYKAALRGGA